MPEDVLAIFRSRRKVARAALTGRDTRSLARTLTWLIRRLGERHAPGPQAQSAKARHFPQHSLSWTPLFLCLPSSRHEVGDADHTCTGALGGCIRARWSASNRAASTCGPIALSAQRLLTLRAQRQRQSPSPTGVWKIMTGMP